jgi:ParB/RepB/Spo0J family partition protein
MKEGHMAEQPQSTRTVERDVLREIPLSRIVVPDGFNPRGEVEDDAELEALAETIRQRGVLQPIRVRATETGDYVVIAGARRYRAAVKAALTIVPAIVRPAGAGDTDEEADLMADAVIENELRKQLDPVQRALGYRRMKEGGLTIKGVAQRLGGIPEKRIRETLAVLDLPQELWPQVADGTIPLSAVKALVRLGKVHAGLPAVAVKRVLDGPLQQWDEPVTWEEVIADPIAVVIGDYEEQLADLPDDVFVAGNSYAVSRFALDGKAKKSLAKLCELLPDVDPESFTVRFDRTLVEQAVALKAAHPSQNGYEHLIVGCDVASQLAGDYIAACLKNQRDMAKRQPPSAVDEPPADEPASVAGPVSAEELEQQRKDEQRRQREADKAKREAALARNEVLGAALVKHLSKVKVDERVLKVLTAAPLAGEMAKIAARGPRLGFPGWTTRTTRKNGSVKVEYPQPSEAQAKAREYLAGAKTAADIAGRSLALLAMARWANEDAVAQSQRSSYELRFSAYAYGEHGMPWRDEAGDLLDDILIERLPHEAAEPIRQAKEEREAQRAEEERRRREQDAVVAEFVERAPSLSRDDRQAEIQRLRSEYGYSALPHERGRKLMDLPEPDQATTDGDQAQPESTDR